MLEAVLPLLRCPRCASASLDAGRRALSCRACGSRFTERAGIFDLLGEDTRLVITPFQRIMQTPAVACIYERAWRPLGYRLASSRAFSSEVAAVLALLETGDQRRVLDVACGTGVFARRLAGRGGSLVVGFDLSWPMLSRARRLAAREGLANLVLLRGTVFRLPFIDAAFPSVNCCGALHLFDRPEEALAEIGRVLCRGGRLALQTALRPARTSLLFRALERSIRFGSFEEGELREMLRGQRLEVLESERHGISCTLLARKAA